MNMTHFPIKCSFILASMLISFQAFGQVCSGNFGDNIFESGDFGTGSSQIVMNDPQIAPGYLYTTSLPPDDGYYTIANYLSAGQIYGDWLPIGDNSPDPKGYMMVVNASNEPGLFYEQTITGLCDNVLYEFSADIINLIKSWSTDRIDPNVSFLLDDRVVYGTGNIPKNESWNTYGFTFTTAPGQTSIKLSLRNNAPGGIGNDLALDNITFRPCGSQALILPESVANICEDGVPFEIFATIVGSAFEEVFIQWQQSFDEGNTWVDLEGEKARSFRFDDLRSGNYYYRYLLADSEAKLDNEKCRTFSNTKIVQVIPKFVNVADSICEGLSIPLGNKNIFTPGIHIDTLQNIIGCDSIVTLDLTTITTQLQGVFNITDPSCDYLSDGAIDVESLTNQGPYAIEIDSEMNMDAGSIQDLDAGEYQYSIVDRYGCVLDTVLVLSDPPAFVVDLGADQTLQLGQRFEISAFVSEPAANYQWTPATISCAPPCEAVSELFVDNVTIALEATSMKGCVDSDQVEVIIEQVETLFIPNIITPNEDGKNDFFTVFPNEINAIDKVVALSIYNRVGIKLFERQSFEPGILELGWDGAYRGRELPSGVYYYSARVQYLNGKTIDYNGYISLIR